MADTLSTSFYLILSGAKKRGWKRELKAVRIVKTTTSIPATDKDEIPLRVDVTVPRALFERPELSVAINVDGDVPRPTVNAETMDNLAARVQEVIGLPVRVTCDLPTAPECEVVE